MELPPRKPSVRQPLWIPVLLIAAVAAIGLVAYGQYSAKSVLEQRIAGLENQLRENVSKLQKTNTSLASDLEVVSKKIGVTDQELTSARRYAEKLRQEHEKAQDQLASELATKASATEVAANVAAAREEAAAKVAEAQKASENKLGTVSGEIRGEIKTVSTDLQSTKQDLAASRRDLVDVKNTLSDQIARNASELATLKLKGERNFVEFDLKKAKKNEMQRVGDIRLELRDTDTKKQKYNLVIQVDDKKLEKKDSLANVPIAFLVGSERLRYEIVVNYVDKDRIRGYLSTPKDKALSAERPVLRD